MRLLKPLTTKLYRKNFHARKCKHREKISACLFGGIQYNTKTNQKVIWEYLQGTKSEIEKISKLLKAKNINTGLFTNTLATKTCFKDTARHFQILHLATHVSFLSQPRTNQRTTGTNRRNRKTHIL